jgi:hypothetical protein
MLYLGGFLCGIRQARWVGTRLVPLAAVAVLGVIVAIGVTCFMVLPAWWIWWAGVVALVDGAGFAAGDHTASRHVHSYSYAYYPFLYSDGPREPRYQRDDSPLEPIRASMVYLVSQARVLEIDLQRRSVRPVIEAEGILSIHMIYRLYPTSPAEDPKVEITRRAYLAVRFEDRAVVLDPHGSERRSYLLPEQVRTKRFYFYEKADGTAIVETIPRNRSPIDLYWIGDSPGAIRSQRVHLKEEPRVVLLEAQRVYLTGPRGVEDPRILSGLFSLVSPVPAVWATVATVALPVAKLGSGEAGSYPAALARSFAETWPGVLIALVVSAGAVWLCLRRQRRWAAPWTRTWSVFVFVFGIPGLLGYWFHRRWPVREPCPHCQKEAPRDREACFACGSEFPEPEPKGIEVFA